MICVIDKCLFLTLRQNKRHTVGVGDFNTKLDTQCDEGCLRITLEFSHSAESNHWVLFQLLYSCKFERSISMLNLIKSPLRSTMGHEQLNGLAMMMDYPRDLKITPEEKYIDKFYH